MQQQQSAHPTPLSAAIAEYFVNNPSNTGIGNILRAMREKTGDRLLMTSHIKDEIKAWVAKGWAELKGDSYVMLTDLGHKEIGGIAAAVV